MIINSKKMFKIFILFFIIISIMAGSVLIAHAEKEPVPKTIVSDAWLIFEPWTGNGTSSVTIGGDYLTNPFSELIGIDKFERLLHDSLEFDSTNYTITGTDNNITITLSEEYLEALDDGMYSFEVEFSDVIIPIKLYVTRCEDTITDVVFLFGTWTGNGSIQVTLDPNTFSFTFYPDLFKNLLYKGESIDPSNYSMNGSMDTTTIILKEDYLKTLDDGEYYFEAEFMNAKIMLKLKVDTSTTPSPKETPTVISNPQTGEQQSISKWFAKIAVLSLCCYVTFLIIFKNKKKTI